MRFSKRKLHFFVFSFFLCWRPRNRKRKKKKMEKAKTPYKNVFFSKVVMQTCEKQKWILAKIG